MAEMLIESAPLPPTETLPNKKIPRVVYIYEQIFTKGICEEEEFWDEFFLLKPHRDDMKKYLSNCDAEVLNQLTSQCIKYLHWTETESKLGPTSSRRSSIKTIPNFSQSRISNAYLNLSILVDSISSFPDFTSVLFASQNEINSLLGQSLKILDKNIQLEESIRENCLQCMLACVNCTIPNPLVTYFYNSPAFVETLLELLVAKRQIHGKNIVAFLSLLTLQNIPEGNSFKTQLSLVEKQSQLIAVIAHTMHVLREFNLKVSKSDQAHQNDESDKKQSWLSKFFSSETSTNGDCRIKAKHSVEENGFELLFLYELIKLNRHALPLVALNAPDKFRFKDGEVLSPTVNFVGNSASMSFASLNSCFLTTLIEYVSILIQNLRSDNSDEIENIVKVAFNILAFIVGDTISSSILFDSNNSFVVKIYQVQMRHRKGRSVSELDRDSDNHGSKKPLAYLNSLIYNDIDHGNSQVF